MKLPEVKEVEPIEKRFHRVSSAAIDILKVCFFTFCCKMLIIVNNGHFPCNRNSGLKFQKFFVLNGTFQLHRPDPSHYTFGYCFYKKDTKGQYWGTTFLSNGEGHRNDRTGQSEPPSEVVPNILVGPNQNGPFYLISNRNFRNFGLNLGPGDLFLPLIYMLSTYCRSHSNEDSNFLLSELYPVNHSPLLNEVL